MSKNVLELRFTYYVKVSASSDGYIKSPPTNETVPIKHEIFGIYDY